MDVDAAAVAADPGRLRRRRELCYAHSDDPATPLEESVAAFDELVTRGVVRYVGLSRYTAQRAQAWIDVATALGAALPVSLQPHYNLLERRHVERDLLPVASRNDLAVLPYQGLAGGFLTGKYHSPADAEGAARATAVGGYLNEGGFAVLRELEAVASELAVVPATVALAWLRSRPTVVAPIAGASSVGQLGALMASADLDLSADHIARLTTASDTFAG